MNKVIFLAKTYYEDNKTWLKLTVQWFGVAALLGAATYLFRPQLINQIINIFKDKFGPNPDKNLSLAREIFIQNTEACLIALVGGIIFGISSFLILFFNGFIIGFVILSLLFLPGNPLRNILYIIAGLSPHGIFELPAFFISSALGMRLGTEWAKKENQGIRRQVFKQNLLRMVKVLPFVILLLLIAAFMEVFVSGQLVGKF